MIIEKENFIDDQSLSDLNSYLESTSDWKVTPDNPLWDKRLISFESINDENIKKIFKQIKMSIQNEIMDTFHLDKELYCELFEFARTPVGLVTNPHSDSTGNDGEDNGTSYRDYSAILYLNNKFSGGNLVFTKQNKTVVPKPGLLAMFESTFENMHNVEEVLTGERYTITSFWTFDKQKAYVSNYLERGV